MSSTRCFEWGQAGLKRRDILKDKWNYNYLTYDISNERAWKLLTFAFCRMKDYPMLQTTSNNLSWRFFYFYFNWKTCNWLIVLAHKKLFDSKSLFCIKQLKSILNWLIVLRWTISLSFIATQRVLFHSTRFPLSLVLFYVHEHNSWKCFCCSLFVDLNKFKTSLWSFLMKLLQTFFFFFPVPKGKFLAWEFRENRKKFCLLSVQKFESRCFVQDAVNFMFWLYYQCL